jgi:hypothetical protein
MKDKLTATLPQFGDKKLPRGIRNNNPGNLRKTPTKWAGKVSNPLDTAFESFDTMANGVRAALRNAYTQWNRGKDTISEFIAVWAPPSENDTAKYVAQVAKAAGISPTKEFTFGNNDVTAKIMYAVFVHENGPIAKKYITPEQVKAQLAALYPAAASGAAAPKNAPKV